MEEAIINCVHSKEEIWNPNHRNHKNVYILQRKWLDVARELGKDVKIVKKKWKYLRDYFVKERKKIMSMQPDDNINDVCTWPYYNMLSFLSDIFLSDNSDINSTTDAQNNIKSETSDVDLGASSIYLESQIESNDSPFCNISAHRKRSVPREDNTTHLETPSIKIIRTEMESEHYEDEDLLFFRSLLPDIKSLSKQRKRRLKLKIQELIVREIEDSEGLSSVTFS